MSAAKASLRGAQPVGTPAGALASAALRLERHQSFGACTRQFAVAGTMIRDTRLPPSSTIARHAHADAYLCIVLDGAYQEFARRDTHCEPGMIVVHPGEQPHANRVGPAGARCVNVELDAALLAEPVLQALMRMAAPARLAATHPTLARLRAALGQEQGAGSSAALAAYAATLELLCHAAQVPAEPRRRLCLQRVIDRLEADLATTPPLAELAALVGVHASQLTRAFRAQQAESIGAYLRRRRLEAADAQLRAGALPLVHIAAEAGFCDQAHFTRAYRRHFGVTPGLRRRQGRLA